MIAETTSFQITIGSKSLAQSLKHYRDIINIIEVMGDGLALSNTVEEVTFTIGTTISPNFFLLFVSMSQPS